MPIASSSSPRDSRRPLDLLLDSLALATLVAHVGVFATFWPRLPSIVPTHFGISGAPDGTGPRGWLFVFPVIALVYTFVFWLLAARPEWHNIPFDLTPENNGRVRAVSSRMVRAMNLYLNALLLWGLVGTVRVALGQASGMGVGFLPAALGMLAAILGLGIVAMKRAARSG